MAKTNLTLELEKGIYEATVKMGTFGCFEVTIGFSTTKYGRVDYMTMDTKGIFRCYEIKVSKSDFHSRAKKTFLGHFNYYVMPMKLYQDVKNEIPKNIGVHNGIYVVKNAQKQELGIDEQILKDSMIRSLSREQDKFRKTCDINYLSRLKSMNYNLNKQVHRERDERTKYSNAISLICDKYKLNYGDVHKFVRDMEAEKYI